MRRIFLGATTLALTAATSVFAADLPAAGPVMVPTAPAAFSWTGCYVGGQIGDVARDITRTDGFGASTTQNSSGLLAGGQIGCDRQFGSGWVLGVEGGVAWSGLKNSMADQLRNLATGVVVPSQFIVTNNFLASVTGRLGYSFLDHKLLWYGKGGAAWTSEKVEETFTTVQGIAVDPNASATLTGWIVGTGVEWAFAPSWSTRLEFDAYGFGNRSLTLTGPPNVSVNINSFKDAIGTLTGGLNYRF